MATSLQPAKPLFHTHHSICKIGDIALSCLNLSVMDALRTYHIAVEL